MRRISKKRALRYGGISLLLCALAIGCAVIINVIAGALSLRYDWMYLELNRPAVYEISDACRDYIEEYVIPEVDRLRENGKKDENIKIIFCDGGTEIADEELYKYIYDSFEEVCGLFPGYIETEHINIWETPGIAKKYGVTSTQDIVCLFDGRFETMNLEDFYIVETDGYESVPVAYNGEKIVASCLMRVTQREIPMCYMTVNHGEAYGDFEFMRMMAEAGYTVGFLDLYADEIPEDCDILVSFNPKKDLAINDGTSEISEVERLDRFMSDGGKYMVFLSSDSFASGGFANLEGFLETYGIKYMHKKTEGGVEAAYLVKDNANSLTVDGYTVLAEAAENGITAGRKAAFNLPNSFGKTTYMSVSEGFSPHGPIYASQDGKRIFSPLFLAQGTAIAYADGKAVARASERDFILMSLSERICDNGKTSYLLASASVDFASKDAMQSSVLGNSRAITEIIRYMGKENAPSSLVFKPFGESEIQSLTARDANIVTAFMVCLPAVIVSSVGIVVLVRRKNR